MNLTRKSQLKLFPLTIRKDKKYYIVEETLSGEFFEMPEICIDAIERINKGEHLADIETQLKLNYPNEEVDIVDFAEQLLELGLIQTIDDKEVPISKRRESPTGYTWISPKFAKLFFNKLSSKIYIGLILINILILILNPHLLPSYQDLFLFDAMMFNILTYSAISLILIMFHEFGHVLAVRAHDLPASMNVGHRLFLVVFETDLTSAWKLAPEQRNTLYLAGIYFDQLVMFIAFCLILLFPNNSLLIGLLSIVIFDLFIKLIYQCCFYMKTDLYYLFENVTGCYNLMENGKKYLHKWVPFIGKYSQTELFTNEKSIIRWYGLFYLVGVLLTSSLFLLYFIPQTIYAFGQTLPELLHPGDNPYFWDAVVFLGQIMVMIILLIFSWNKNRTINKEELT